MMTEEEAKKKWCPFVRHEDDKGGSWNRTVSAMKRIFGWDGGNPYPEETCNCIASECMAWRWGWETIPSDHPYEDPGSRQSTTRGFCGLAGAE